MRLAPRPASDVSPAPPAASALIAAVAWPLGTATACTVEAAHRPAPHGGRLAALASPLGSRGATRAHVHGQFAFHEVGSGFFAFAPTPMRDVANNRLATFVHRDVLHRDLLLAAGPISLERLHLSGEGPGKLVLAHGGFARRLLAPELPDRSAIPTPSWPSRSAHLAGSPDPRWSCT